MENRKIDLAEQNPGDTTKLWFQFSKEEGTIDICVDPIAKVGDHITGFGFSGTVKEILEERPLRTSNEDLQGRIFQKVKL